MTKEKSHEPEVIRANLIKIFNESSLEEREEIAGAIIDIVLCETDTPPEIIKVAEIILEAIELKKAGRIFEAAHHLEKVSKK